MFLIRYYPFLKTPYVCRVKHLKILALTNIIGFLVCAAIVTISIELNPFPWGVFIIIISLNLGLPFIAFAIVTLRNLRTQKVRAIRVWFIICFLIAWLPSLALPFNFGLYGVVFSALMLSIGLLGIFRLKDPLLKMLLFNYLGIIALTIDLIGVLWIVNVNW